MTLKFKSDSNEISVFRLGEKEVLHKILWLLCYLKNQDGRQQLSWF